MTTMTTMTSISRGVLRLFTDASYEYLRTPSAICISIFFCFAYITNNSASILLGSPVLVRGISAYLSIPVLSWFHFSITYQRNLSVLYDMHGNPLDYKKHPLDHWNRPWLPFLPRKSNISQEEISKVYQELNLKQQRQSKEHEIIREETETTALKNIPARSPGGGWALVTGASRGIGREIVIELARRQIPSILVARDGDKLNELSTFIQGTYGVPTKVLELDLSLRDAAENIFRSLNDDGIQVDILIHNAGIAQTEDLVDMNLLDIENIIQVNTVVGTKLCQLFGKGMKDRKRGRIVLISSITGAAPGVPTASVYAATKAFLRSLATSMRNELGPYGVGVTCVMPGAVKDTEFAERGNLSNAFIWYLPGALTPEVVSSSTIHSMLIGRPEVVVGWINVILANQINLLPARIVTALCGLAWRPIPFSFFSSDLARKSNDESEL